jgi:hypothetical protein
MLQSIINLMKVFKAFFSPKGFLPSVFISIVFHFSFVFALSLFTYDKVRGEVFCVYLFVYVCVLLCSLVININIVSIISMPFFIMLTNALYQFYRGKSFMFNVDISAFKTSLFYSIIILLIYSSSLIVKAIIKSATTGKADGS